MNQPKFNDEKDQAENESEVKGGRKRRYLCEDLFHGSLLRHDERGQKPEGSEAEGGLGGDLHRHPGLRSVPGAVKLEPNNPRLKAGILHFKISSTLYYSTHYM